MSCAVTHAGTDEADSTIDHRVAWKSMLAGVSVGVTPPRSPATDSDRRWISESDRLRDPLPGVVLDPLQPSQIRRRHRQR